MMHIKRSANILGALALSVADRLHQLEPADQAASPLAGPPEALVHLSHCANPTIESLSAALGLSHSAGVRLADRLERDRLADRRAAAGDRRAVALKLTPRGSKWAAAILARRSAFLMRLLEQAGSPEECKAFVTMTERMLKSLANDGTHLYRNCRLCDFASCTDCPVSEAAR